MIGITQHVMPINDRLHSAIHRAIDTNPNAPPTARIDGDEITMAGACTRKRTSPPLTCPTHI
ncbi:Uncharacterised protein [Vibrio cholerae]|nr:Uncharacterised protein [Vibrio cholerae]